MKVGDLVCWKMTGKVCIYLGLKDDMHRFYSPEYGIVERWARAFSIRTAVEVVNEAR